MLEGAKSIGAGAATIASAGAAIGIGNVFSSFQLFLFFVVLLVSIIVFRCFKQYLGKRVEQCCYVALCFSISLFFLLLRAHLFTGVWIFSADVLALLASYAFSGSSDSVVNNQASTSSEWLTYTTDMVEDSASSGRSESVNQPIQREHGGPSNAQRAPQPTAAPEAEQWNNPDPRFGEAGPSVPYPYQRNEIIGGDSVEAIQRRLLAKYDDPSYEDITLARIEAEDLFEVKVEIMKAMADLDPTGDWMGQGARALDNPRTSTGEYSLQQLYGILDQINDHGITASEFAELKRKVFLKKNI